jgi:dCMP deaminase
MQKRISKNEYYLSIAREVAKRSTCLRRKFGTIIVCEDVIVATGYVGAPRKTKDCLERNSCLRDELKIPHGQRYELCRSVHSEQNAIINAARSGAKILNGDLFLYGMTVEDKPTDAFPCFICKKMIINSGIKNVICSAKDGSYKSFRVEDWVKDWQEGDVLDDKDQYGKNLNSKEDLS